MERLRQQKLHTCANTSRAGQGPWVEVFVSENTSNEPLEHCGRYIMQAYLESEFFNFSILRPVCKFLNFGQQY